MPLRETQPLITLNEVISGQQADAYFGHSLVEARILGDGSQHKVARKGFNRSQALLVPTFNVSFGKSYLHHNNSNNNFFQTDFPDGKRFFIATRAEATEDALKSHLGVHFVSGMCIGSSTSIMGRDQYGAIYHLLESDTPGKIHEPFTNVLYDPKLTVYEADVLSILKTLEAFKESKKGNSETKISFHIPAPEYILYGLQYMDNGVFTAEQFREYINFIFIKGKQLQNLVSKRLGKIVGNPNVTIGSPLDFLRTEDLFKVHNNGLNDFIENVASRDALWQLVISHNPPNSWVDLANASYTYLYLYLSQQSLGKMNLIGVEHPEEMTIFIHANKIAKATGMAFDMVGIYPHSHVFTTTGEPRRLFRHQYHDRLSELKTIVSQYNYENSI